MAVNPYQTSINPYENILAGYSPYGAGYDWKNQPIKQPTANYPVAQQPTITPGSYDPQSLSQQERQVLWEYFGHTGPAPVGYGGEGGGTMGGDGDPVDQLINAQVQVFEQTFGKTFKQLEEWEKTNPFIFDEELAKKSALERFDPYYQAELRDFMTGIDRQRGRSTQDEERIRRELTASSESYLGKHKRQLDQALEASREGFAGAGLYFSGKRLRREGEVGIEAEAERGDYLRQQGLRQEESQLRQARSLEDLLSQQKTYQRRIGAEKETALLTDVARQKQEQLQKRELERQQIAGPLYGIGGSSLSSILNY